MAALFFSASKIYQVATTNKLFHYIILTWRITIQFVMSSLDVASVNWWPDIDKVGKLTFCGLDLLYMDEASSTPELS